MKNEDSNSVERALSIVERVGAINLTGQVIPHSWYHTLLKPNGKPHLAAITILADIVYWYRPINRKDATQQGVKGNAKKFAGDKYRTSYGDLAKRFRISKLQVQEAIMFLESEGIILKEIRQRDEVAGRVYGNGLYLEVCPEVLARITETPEAYRAQRSTHEDLKDRTESVLRDGSSCVRG